MLPPEQQALQHSLNIEIRVFGVAHAQGDIFEITKQRHVLNRAFFGHLNSRPGGGAPRRKNCHLVEAAGIEPASERLPS